MKKHPALYCALLLASVSLAVAHAQTPAAARPTTATAPQPPAGLYAALGEKAGIVRLVDGRIASDVRRAAPVCSEGAY